MNGTRFENRSNTKDASQNRRMNGFSNKEIILGLVLRLAGRVLDAFHFKETHWVARLSISATETHFGTRLGTRPAQ